MLGRTDSTLRAVRRPIGILVDINAGITKEAMMPNTCGDEWLSRAK